MMDQQELNSIGHEIIELLKMHGIESEEFGITIHVSKEYYKSIERNFRNVYSDISLVFAIGRTWSVNLQYVPPMILEDQPNSGPL